jgi:hypothetical protein
MNPRTLITAAALALAACGGSGAPDAATDVTARTLEVPCSQHSDPDVQKMTDAGIASASAAGLAAGRYALPADPAPTVLVVAFHGHGNDSCAWRTHLQQIAAHGAAVIAMDYSGQRQEPVENYGWFVREGAADSIAAAQWMLARHPSIRTVIAFGISMGGNAAGLAVASPDALRADGSPLFDYLVDVEGVNNLAEEYAIVRAVEPVNAGAAQARQEIEEENGGSIEQAPQAYADATLIARVMDMASLKGAVVINAVDDGLVSPSQSPEMALALNVAGVPSHLFTILANGGAEDGSTLTSVVGDPVFSAAGETYRSPFAGHGWEGSDTQLVIATGFEQLFALIDGGSVAPGETVVPGL